MRTLKIFNFTQANYLFQNGCIIENLGYGHKDGKPYVKFICDDKFDKVMENWKNKNR